MESVRRFVVGLKLACSLKRFLHYIYWCMVATSVFFVVRDITMSLFVAKNLQDFLQGVDGGNNVVMSEVEDCVITFFAAVVFLALFGCALQINMGELDDDNEEDPASAKEIIACNRFYTESTQKYLKHTFSARAAVKLPTIEENAEGERLAEEEYLKWKMNSSSGGEGFQNRVRSPISEREKMDIYTIKMLLEKKPVWKKLSKGKSGGGNSAEDLVGKNSKEPLTAPTDATPQSPDNFEEVAVNTNGQAPDLNETKTELPVIKEIVEELIALPMHSIKPPATLDFSEYSEILTEIINSVGLDENTPDTNETFCYETEGLNENTPDTNQTFCYETEGLEGTEVATITGTAGTTPTDEIATSNQVGSNQFVSDQLPQELFPPQTLPTADQYLPADADLPNDLTDQEEMPNNDKIVPAAPATISDNKKP